MIKKKKRFYIRINEKDKLGKLDVVLADFSWGFGEKPKNLIFPYPRPGRWTYEKAEADNRERGIKKGEICIRWRKEKWIK